MARQKESYLLTAEIKEQNIFRVAHMSVPVKADNSTFYDIVLLSTLHCCQLIEPKYRISRICFSR